MKNRLMKKKLRIILPVAIALWIVVGIIDFKRINEFEKPIFCIPAKTADDGGSGYYVGLGYSFDIEGNFMPEDEFPGVTKWTYYLFGAKIAAEIRD
ncbi:MAG: hypothetical protein IJC39_02110 [Firmicutes bacterium]|nr:hypothetical protein [Bacillota bacterium]